MQLLICVDMKSFPLQPTFSVDVVGALDDLDRIRTIWPNAMLLFTNAGEYGFSEIHK